MRTGRVAGPALPLCTGPRLRPLVVGYLRILPTDPPGHIDQLAAELSVFTDRTGLTLADIYAEDVSSREGAAFDALIEALRRPHIHAVVIPSQQHFSRFNGMYQATCTLIDIETGADILIANTRNDQDRS